MDSEVVEHDSSERLISPAAEGPASLGDLGPPSPAAADPSDLGDRGRPGPAAADPSDLGDRGRPGPAAADPSDLGDRGPDEPQPREFPPESSSGPGGSREPPPPDQAETAVSGEDRLQPVLAARAEGRLRMWEAYRGEVVNVNGDTVLVQYDVNGSVIEQTYERSQFLGGRLPEMHAELEVHVIVADVRPRRPIPARRRSEVTISHRPDDSPSPGPPPSDEPRIDIHLLHCGHGDTILVRLPGDRWGLIDCYLPEQYGIREGFFEFVRRQGIRNLDFIMQTHPDRDHYHGMKAVIDHFLERGDGIGYYIDTGLNARRGP